MAGSLGIDLGVVQPFTREIAALTAREFMTLLKKHLGLAGLVVGPDFALGRNRAGNIDVLAALEDELGYRLIVMQPVDWQGQHVRSSNVRQSLAVGNVTEAADLIGKVLSCDRRCGRGGQAWAADRQPDG